MKIQTCQATGASRHPAACAGHTLLEMMFVMGTMLFIILALVTVNLMGERIDELINSKCGASDSSRQAIGEMGYWIRSAKMWSIGNMANGTNFVGITNGTLQGTALQLCQYTNGSQFMYYYFNTSDIAHSNGQLMGMSTTNWQPYVIASNLINTLYFTAENFNGATQTISANGWNYKNIIHVNLQFCQFQYPQTLVGTNQLYDYYKLEFRYAPHLPE